MAIIMDGNGRWAKKKSLPRAFGHKQGVKTVKKIVKAANSLGVKVLTLYAFSTENWKRPESEIRALMVLLKYFLSKEIDELDRENVNIKILGDLSKFSEDIKIEVEKACKLTSDNTGLKLNIALNYGARQEILQAYEKMLKQGIKKPTEEVLSSFLYTAGLPDPDLLIRTSGEFRVSNFLLWQIAYSEIYIVDKLWPDFTAQDFEIAIKNFQNRQRRFGGIVLENSKK
ncbi:MAG: isoprenyl transferase [Endomicrobium sp.]|nr:isoprenyl transferase [Endomicrobium sp.]